MLLVTQATGLWSWMYVNLTFKKKVTAGLFQWRLPFHQSSLFNAWVGMLLHIHVRLSCVSYGWSPNCVGWHWGWLHFFNCPKKLPGGNGYASTGGTAHSITALWLWWFMLGSEPGTNSLRPRKTSRFGRSMDMLGVLQCHDTYGWCFRGIKYETTTIPPKKTTWQWRNTIWKDVSPIENGGFSIVISCFGGGACESTWHQWTFHVVPSPCKMLKPGSRHGPPPFPRTCIRRWHRNTVETTEEWSSSDGQIQRGWTTMKPPRVILMFWMVYDNSW